MSGPSLSPDDPLLAFLSGKRQWERRCTDVAVVLRGPHADFAARALNLSEGGVLLHLADPAFESSSGPGRAAEILSLVEDHFLPDFLAWFPDHEIGLPAEVVRIMVDPDEDGGSIRLGCRFQRVLTPAESKRLLPAEEAMPAETPVDAPVRKSGRGRDKKR